MSQILNIKTAAHGLDHQGPDGHPEFNFCQCSTTLSHKEAVPLIEAIGGHGIQVAELVRTEEGRASLERLLDSVDQRFLVQIVDKREVLVDLVYEHFFWIHLDYDGLRESRFHDYAKLCLNQHARMCTETENLGALIEGVVQFSYDFVPETCPHDGTLFFEGNYGREFAAVSSLTELVRLLNKRSAHQEAHLFGGERLLNNTLLRRALALQIRAWNQKGLVESVVAEADEAMATLDRERSFGRHGLALQCRREGLTGKDLPQSVTLGGGDAIFLARVIAELTLACHEAEPSVNNQKREVDPNLAKLTARLQRHFVGAKPLPSIDIHNRIEELEVVNKQLLDAMNRRLWDRHRWLAHIEDEVPESDWERWAPRIKAVPSGSLTALA